MRSDSRKIVFGILAGLVCAGIVAFGFIKLMGDATSRPENGNIQTSAGDQDDFNLESIWEYRTAYMGEAPKVSQLFSYLPLNFYKREVELVSTEFRTEVFYNGTMEELGGERVRKAIIYNSIASFALVENLGEVDYHLDGVVYMVKRENVLSFCQEQGIDWESIAYHPIWIDGQQQPDEPLTEEKKILWKQMAARLDESDLQKKAWNLTVVNTTEERFAKMIEENRARQQLVDGQPTMADGANFMG